MTKEEYLKNKGKKVIQKAVCPQCKFEYIGKNFVSVQKCNICGYAKQREK